MGIIRNFIQSFLPTEKPQARRVLGRSLLGHNELYDGEKTDGGMGRPKSYIVDHYRLQERSFQLFLDSDIGSNIIRRMTDWVIGNGLTLNADPNEEVLLSSGVEIDEDTFSNQVESRFNTFTKARFGSHSGEEGINAIAKKAYTEASVAGDVLCLQRVDKKTKLPTIQLVEAKYIMTPLNGESEKKEGRCINGVQVDQNGKHLGYWIEVNFGKYEYFPAWSRNGNYRMAWMVYGRKYRANDVRGIPLTASVMETIAKLDRYKEATVGSAEERAKIAYQIVRDKDSDESTPMLSRFRQKDKDLIDPDDGQIDRTREYIAETTQKMTFDMPVGTELKSLESDVELNFESFFKVNLRLICATMGIPMEVALSWYDSNYSASRAALKDWEHTLKIEREKFSNDFYKRIYEVWFDLEVLGGKVNAPDFELLIQRNDYMAICAYKECTFRGANIPHIDPEKEARAERIKLGNDEIPLTTAEESAERLGSTSGFKAIVKQFSRELSETEEIREKQKQKEVSRNEGD